MSDFIFAPETNRKVLNQNMKYTFALMSLLRFALNVELHFCDMSEEC